MHTMCVLFVYLVMVLLVLWVWEFLVPLIVILSARSIKKVFGLKN